MKKANMDGSLMDYIKEELELQPNMESGHKLAALTGVLMTLMYIKNSEQNGLGRDVLNEYEDVRQHVSDLLMNHMMCIIQNQFDEL